MIINIFNTCNIFNIFNMCNIGNIIDIGNIFNICNIIYICLVTQRLPHGYFFLKKKKMEYDPTERLAHLQINLKALQEEELDLATIIDDERNARESRMEALANDPDKSSEL